MSNTITVGADLLPCAHCGAKLERESAGLYRHPRNGCFLWNYQLQGPQFSAWNNRAALSGRATIPSEADERPGCRMQGGICACRSGGSFGGCARERAYCCPNEPARAATPDIATTAARPCDCCYDIRVAEAIHGEGATTAADQQGAAQAQAGALYTCKGKGGEYALIGVVCGAGTSRGTTVNLYRETATGVMYYRTPADFADRMEPLTGNECKPCAGSGYIETGIDESPTTMCRKCDGAGSTTTGNNT